MQYFLLLCPFDGDLLPLEEPLGFQVLVPHDSRRVVTSITAVSAVRGTPLPVV